MSTQRSREEVENIIAEYFDSGLTCKDYCKSRGIDPGRFKWWLKRQRNLKECDRMKMLLWDRNGFWLFYKRLEQGCFQMPSFASEYEHNNITLSYDQLLLILEGIDISSVQRRKRFSR